MQMVVCAGAVFVFYISYGYLQEKIFRVPGFAEFGWYMTLLQFVVYALLAYAESMITQRHVERKCVHAHTRYRIAGRRIPMRQYVMLSLYTVGTMGLSNAAVGYLNYPTQVIFKCCKLVPVLIGGVLIQGKQFGVADVAAAFCMSIGLVFFSLADSKVSPNFNGKGTVCALRTPFTSRLCAHLRRSCVRRNHRQCARETDEKVRCNQQ
jgi:adenosine 3'-phospho 5'-phosphosulfate transporter B3